MADCCVHLFLFYAISCHTIYIAITVPKIKKLIIFNKINNIEFFVECPTMNVVISVLPISTFEKVFGVK